MELLKSQSKETSNHIVVADKTIFYGNLISHIVYGGGLLPISHGFALKVIKLNDKFTKLQIIQHSIGVPMQEQKYHKTSTATPKKKPKTIQVNTQVKNKQVIDI